MGHVFQITAGDSLPIIGGQLQDENGNPIILAAASSVMFLMRPSGVATDLIATSALWSTATEGASAAHVEYPWAPGGVNTPTAGVYQGRWRVTFPGNVRQSVPNPGFVPIIISE